MSIRSGVSRLRTELRALPVVLRGMLVGSVLLGALGGVTGLVVGHHVYPPTAWFAALELGVPAGMVGCFLGLVAGVVAEWLGRPRGG